MAYRSGVSEFEQRQSGGFGKLLLGTAGLGIAYHYTKGLSQYGMKWRGIPLVGNLLFKKGAAASVGKGAGIKNFLKYVVGGAKATGGKAAPVMAGIGVGLTAAAIGYAGITAIAGGIRGVVKSAKSVATISRYAPEYLEQKLAPIRKMLRPRPEFSGDTTGIRYAATERGRAIQAIQQAHGMIQDRRFIGEEARYYSQF